MAVYNPRTMKWEGESSPSINPDANSRTIMPFGKYQGCYLSEIPIGYLKWCLREMALDTELKSAIQASVDEA